MSSIQFRSTREDLMAVQFKDYLTQWLGIVNYSHKELVASLQSKHYSSFSGLDAVTISRWKNGKTTPPLYKQFLIAQSLNIDIVDFLLSIDSNISTPTLREKKVTHQLKNALNHSLSSLSYKSISKTIRAEIKDHSFKVHSALLGKFYQNISALHPFTAALYGMGNSINYKDITLRNKDHTVIGHWSCIVDIQSINGISSFVSLRSTEAQRSVLISPGYYANADHHFEIILQTLCLYLLSYNKEKDYAYIFVVEYQPLLEFYRVVFNAEEIKYYPPLEKKDKMGVYLFKVHIMEAIANPIILPKIQKKLSCVLNCKERQCYECNP